jgi:4-amino-4-deoxy-L-arabinose transferase-like glycosyltransferase
VNSRIKKWWWISLFVKLALAAILPLSSDEAYYWVWSKNLQLSYFDHPGMVAWLFKLGESFESLGQAVRWPAVILGHLTLLVWFFILKPIMNEEKYFYWLLLCLFAPLVGGGALIVTPDLPVLFFWALAILALQRTLAEASFKNSLLLGFSLGAGFCSKYHIVLFVPCALAYLTLEKKWSAVKVRSLAVVTISGFIFSLPVLIWNYKNDFQSFVFQIQHGLQRPEWDFFWTYSYLIGQILLLFPIPVWLVCRYKFSSAERFLIYFSMGPLLFFLLSSFRALVEMNWPIIGYHSFYALAAIAMTTIRPLKWTIGTWVALAVTFLSLVYVPWMDPLPGKIKEIHTYDRIIPLIPKYQPFFAETYQMASVIWYKTKVPTYKLQEMSRIDFYDGLPQKVPKTNSFYLAMDKIASFPPWIYQQGFSGELVETVDDTYVILRIFK